MTQSDGPAMQGGFDFEADSGFYAGIWGSNVNFNDGAGSELDYYAGYGFSLGEVGVDLGYIAFDYPENQSGLDFEEIYLGNKPILHNKTNRFFWTVRIDMPFLL